MLFYYTLFPNNASIWFGFNSIIETKALRDESIREISVATEE